MLHVGTLLGACGGSRRLLIPWLHVASMHVVSLSEAEQGFWAVYVPCSEVLHAVRHAVHLHVMPRQLGQSLLPSAQIDLAHCHAVCSDKCAPDPHARVIIRTEPLCIAKQASRSITKHG
jgi:hypothetical protein